MRIKDIKIEFDKEKVSKWNDEFYTELESKEIGKKVVNKLKKNKTENFSCFYSFLMATNIEGCQLMFGIVKYPNDAGIDYQWQAWVEKEETVMCPSLKMNFEKKYFYEVFNVDVHTNYCSDYESLKNKNLYISYAEFVLKRSPKKKDELLKIMPQEWREDFNKRVLQQEEAKKIAKEYGKRQTIKEMKEKALKDEKLQERLKNANTIIDK